jgi:hypothetical protein
MFFLVRQGGTEGNLRNSCSIPVLEMNILIYHTVRIKFLFGPVNFSVFIYIYIYTTSEKPVNDQSYGVLDRYGITILYK